MARVGIVIVAALVAVGCAEDARVFDPDVVTQAVADEVEAVGVIDVACAALDAVDPELGADLSCVGVLNGDLVELAVAAAPAVDGAIDVAADIVTPLFDVAAVETAAAARLDADLGGAPEVDCLERLVVIEPGRRIECRVTAEGGTAGPVDRTLTIVVLDADANWEIDLTP